MSYCQECATKDAYIKELEDAFASAMSKVADIFETLKPDVQQFCPDRIQDFEAYIATLRKVIPHHEQGKVSQ